jgi:hypothetical protein
MLINILIYSRQEFLCSNYDLYSGGDDSKLDRETDYLH